MEAPTMFIEGWFSDRVKEGWRLDPESGKVMKPYKMYCVFSEEAVKAMKGNRGKLAAQAGHAYLHTWEAEKAFPEEAKAYRDSERSYKIALVATSEKVLELAEKYRSVCGVSIVEDAGFTVFDGKTLTAVGIGPIAVERFEPELTKILI